MLLWHVNIKQYQVYICKWNVKFAMLTFRPKSFKSLHDYTTTNKHQKTYLYRWCQKNTIHETKQNSIFITHLHWRVINERTHKVGSTKPIYITNRGATMIGIDGCDECNRNDAYEFDGLLDRVIVPHLVVRVFTIPSLFWRVECVLTLYRKETVV